MLGVGDRLQARRVRALRRRAREARGALRGAARHHQGAVDAGLAFVRGRATTRSRAGSSRSRCQKPHPPIWIGGWGDITLRRAATLADNWIPGPTADLARLLQGKQQFLANRAAAGRTEPVAEWPLTRDVIIADTDAEARELAERHIMVSYRREYAGGWKHPFIDASIATDLDTIKKDRFLIGRPDQVIRGPQAVRRAVRDDAPDLPAVLPRHAAPRTSCASSSSSRRRSCRRSSEARAALNGRLRSTSATHARGCRSATESGHAGATLRMRWRPHPDRLSTRPVVRMERGAPAEAAGAPAQASGRCRRAPVRPPRREPARHRRGPLAQLAMDRGLCAARLRPPHLQDRADRGPRRLRACPTSIHCRLGDPAVARAGARASSTPARVTWAVSWACRPRSPTSGARTCARARAKLLRDQILIVSVVGHRCRTAIPSGSPGTTRVRRVGGRGGGRHRRGASRLPGHGRPTAPRWCSRTRRWPRTSSTACAARWACARSSPSSAPPAARGRCTSWPAASRPGSTASCSSTASSGRVVKPDGSAASRGRARRAGVVGADVYEHSRVQVDELLAWRRAGAWNRAILAVGGITTVERARGHAARRCRRALVAAAALFDPLSPPLRADPPCRVA